MQLVILIVLCSNNPKLKSESGKTIIETSSISNIEKEERHILEESPKEGDDHSDHGHQGKHDCFFSASSCPKIL